MKMQRQHRPTFLLSPLVAAVGLALTGSALAEPLNLVPWFNNADMTRYDTNYIELGGMYNNKGSGSTDTFGEWTGLRDNGGYVVGNFNWLQRDTEKANYFNAWGYNLGLDSRQLGGGLGKQGNYNLYIEYDSFVHSTSDTTQFVHNNLGGDPMMPFGFGKLPSTSTPSDVDTAYSPLLHEYGIKQRRDVAKAGGNILFGGNLEFIANYREDRRGGDRLIGTSLVNSKDMQLPLGLDDKTQQVEAKLRWTTEKAQLEAGYNFSRYQNDAPSMTWENAFSTTSTPYGRVSSAPSNDFNQLQLSGGYDFTPTTRFTGTASYGVTQQNDQYLAYTINPGPLGNTPLPQNNLDGKIEDTLLDLNLTSKPISRLSVKLNYKFEDHKDKSNPDTYYPVDADGNTVSDPAAFLSRPYSYKDNTLKADANYALFKGATLRGYYTYQKRDYEQYLDHANTNTAGIEWRQRMNALFTGSLKYEYKQRRVSGIEDDAVLATDVIKRPYMYASYDQNGIRATAYVTPKDAFTVSFSGNWYDRDYKGPGCTNGTGDTDSCMGLQKGLGQSYTIDGQWNPVSIVTTYAFYTWSQLRNDQTGKADGFTTDVTDKMWMQRLDNRENTLGLGAELTPEDKKYSVGFLYSWTQGKDTTDLKDIGSLVIAHSEDVPDAKYTRNQVQLYGKYQWSKNLTLRANYVYEKLKGYDWAYDDVTMATSGMIPSYMKTPNGTNNLFMLSLAYTMP